MEGFANITGSGGDKTTEDWIEDGNKHFRNKDYDEAIKCYFFGMMKEPFNIRLLCNRSAAYTNQGYYWLGLHDANLVLEKGDPMHEKGIYRKAKALFGMNRHQEAIDFLQDMKSKTTKPSQLKIYDQLIADGETYINQAKYGDNYYDIVGMIKSKWSHIIRGEYTGPLKITDIKGKGRGVVATEAIRPGQLILAHRAFAVYFGNEADFEEDKKDKHKDKPMETDPDKKEEIFQTKLREKLAKLVSKYLMTLGEEQGRYLGDLYAAGVKIRGSKADNPDVVVTDQDMERIEAMVKYNAFSADYDDIFTADKLISGLWLMPSYFNHSCFDCNCKWNIYGDFMMIRAFKPIAKGEELLISYVSPDMEYSKRTKVFEDLGFKCDCSLCELDGKDSAEIQNKRKECLQLVDEEIEKPSSERSPEILNSLVQQLEALRPKDQKSNVYLIKPLTKLAEKYFEMDKYTKAAKLFEKAYDLIKGTVFCTNAVQFILLNLIASYVQQGEHDRAHEWAAQLRKDTKLVYGDSIEFPSELYDLFSSPSVLDTVTWIKGVQIRI